MKNIIKKIGKKFLPLFLALTLLTIPSCKNKSKTIERVKINGIEYLIQGDKLEQITKDDDRKIRLGIISDVHGYCDNVEYFSQKFIEKGINAIIINGDIAQHFRQKKNPNWSDYDEIYNCIKAVAKTKLPVFVLPGNNDPKKVFEKALKDLKKKYPNVFNLAEIRALDLDGADIVSNPYGNDNGFSYFNFSFTASNNKIFNEIIKYAEMLKSDNDPEILLSHQPPRTPGNCIDDIFNGKDVGNHYISEAMKKAGINFGVFGHIHEARGGESNGNCVEEGKFYSQLYVNPGSASPWQDIEGRKFYGSAAILEIDDGKARYWIIENN